jgi:tetratricopeptide (TPR) repeat protein
MVGSEKIRIFVAMPFSTMGERAPWPEVPEIRRDLFDTVAQRLSDEFGRPTELVIEDEKTTSTPIHDSMFNEALDADVYIADLTNNNPNVFLELGVRWAARDGVTILVTQDADQHPRFNVGGNRIFHYGPKPGQLRAAISSIVAAASYGLRNADHVDSPVRRHRPAVPTTRRELDDLHNEIDRLRGQQAEDLIEQARRSPDQAVELLTRAVERHPSPRTYFELGLALRQTAKDEVDYERAAAALRTATKMRSDFGPAWRELGITLSKGGQLAAAADAFQEAVRIDPNDHETWATLGGLFRRRARKGNGEFDLNLLRQALDSYQRATALTNNDTYPRLNEARVRLLLSAENPADRPAVHAYFRRLERLTRFAAEETQIEADQDSLKRADLPWKLLDLADCLLLSGQGDEGIEVVQSAIDAIPPANRPSYLSSAIEPWEDFLLAGVLDATEARAIGRAVRLAKGASLG